MRRPARLFWILPALAAAADLAMILWTLPAIRAAAGGLPAFDLRPGGYSAEEARAFLSALSGAGRALYLGPQHLLDLAFPALLAATLVLAFRLLLPGGRLWIACSLLALAGMGADYLENVRVRAMLQVWPDPPDAAAIARASLATRAKFLLDGLALAAALAAALWRIPARPGGRRA